MMDVKITHWHKQNDRRVALSPDGKAVTVTSVGLIQITIAGQEFEIKPMISSSNKRWIRLTAKNGNVVVKPVASNAIDIEVDVD